MPLPTPSMPFFSPSSGGVVLLAALVSAGTFKTTPGVKIDFPADFHTKPSMGYLHRCHVVTTWEETWALEKITNLDEILERRLPLSATARPEGPFRDDPNYLAGSMEQVEVAFNKTHGTNPDGKKADGKDTRVTVPLYVPPLLEDEKLKKIHRGKVADGTALIGTDKYLCCEDYNACCDGGVPGSLPTGTWNHIKAFASTYHVRELLDSTPRMLERHYTFYNLMQKNEGGWMTLLTESQLFHAEKGQVTVYCFVSCGKGSGNGILLCTETVLKFPTSLLFSRREV